MDSLDTTWVALCKVGPKVYQLWGKREKSIQQQRWHHRHQSGDRLHIDPLINYYLQAAAQSDREGSSRGWAKTERWRWKWQKLQRRRGCTLCTNLWILSKGHKVIFQRVYYLLMYSSTGTAIFALTPTAKDKTIKMWRKKVYTHMYIYIFAVINSMERSPITTKTKLLRFRKP